MKKWVIVSDSSCDKFTGQYNSENIEFISCPLKIAVKDVEYVDDETLNVNELIEAMNAEKKASRTSCPSAGEFLEAMENGENAFVMTISSGTSASYRSALAAKDMAADEFPEKKVHVIDSRGTGGTLALIIEKLIELINEGLEFDEIAEKIEEYKSSLTLVALLGSYTNLVKNGRMNPIVGAVATALNIKAVVKVTDEDGSIVVCNKTRGMKAGYDLLMKEGQKYKDFKGAKVYIHHCNNLEGAQLVKNELLSTYGAASVDIFETRGLCSYYVMPGGLIVSF